MKTANAERVIAIPKRRDFSDCFIWALLARSLAPMREVRPSRASRGSPVWRAPVASSAADGRAMGPSYYGSCVTPYFGPGSARGCTGSRGRAIRGRRRGRPSGDPGGSGRGPGSGCSGTGLRPRWRARPRQRTSGSRTPNTMTTSCLRCGGRRRGPPRIEGCWGLRRAGRRRAIAGCRTYAAAVHRWPFTGAPVALDRSRPQEYHSTWAGWIPPIGALLASGVEPPPTLPDPSPPARAGDGA